MFTPFGQLVPISDNCHTLISILVSIPPSGCLLIDLMKWKWQELFPFNL